MSSLNHEPGLGVGHNGHTCGPAADCIEIVAPTKEHRYKRPMDLGLLLLAHLLLAPLWAFLWVLISIGVWIEDRGPIFYTQQRVGQGGRIFEMFKFRSMRVKQDREEWLGFTSTSDPRITKMGRLLRRTALDELPQVINLLKGDISLVGPRALPPDMHEGYVNEDPDFPLRLQIRPGLTGLSQIKSPRHCQ